MAIDPWPTVTGMVGTIASWLGLRYFRKIDKLVQENADLKEAVRIHGEHIHDLERTIVAIWKHAFPRSICPISSD